MRTASLVASTSIPELSITKDLRAPMAAAGPDAVANLLAAVDRVPIPTAAEPEV
ncbi:MAG: hypothetical protein HYX32_06630 [Actinobacteria bacterium]|nr:hypothetical protein [Actinomycetota bacterium]